MSATALVGARIPLDDELVDGFAALIEGSRIRAVFPEEELPDDCEVRELDGGILSPGFIDVQVNGGGGRLFNAEPTVECLEKISAAHRRFGTTDLLPTVITDDLHVVERAMRAVETAIERNVPGIAGIHIEGPMLSPTRHGIHDKRHLRRATEDLLDLLRSMSCGRTLVTVAPEVVGPEAIQTLVEAGVVVSAGHTDATYEEMCGGFDAGISGITHLFNVMSPMTSRAPGAVGAALDNQHVWCGIIADGIHVHPATLRIALRSRPLDRFMLVTDAMPPVGTDQASFDLQGRRILVDDDRCTDTQGTLAGSVLTMEAAVRNLVREVGIPVETALLLASTSPAAFLGLSDRGAIAAGKVANLTWLDDDLNVGAVWIDGQEYGDCRQ